jgi:hypothetical protein
VLVEVVRVDVARAGAVRRARDRPHQRRVLHAADEEDELVLLHVRADADRDLGVALEARV